MKLILLCAILAALCGAASAQYLTPDPYRQQQPEFTLPDERDIYRDQQIRQLQQQLDDAQRDHDIMEDRLRSQQLLDNFGCDIHNHCR